MSFFTFLTIFYTFFCASYAAGELTPAEITDFLNWHNDVRRTTAQGNQVCASSTTAEGLESNPGDRCPAGKIKELQWHTGLAELAQWVVEDMVNGDCLFNHSPQLARSNKLAELTEFSGSAGENIALRAMSSTANNLTPFTWDQTCKGWVDNESQYFKHGYGNPTVNGKQIGHFTAIVDDNSQYVGCACISRSNSAGCLYNATYPYHEEQWCSCNFFPAGNVGGSATPYTANGVCDQSTNPCPSGYTCVNSLCAADTPSPTSSTPEPTTPQPTSVTPSPVPSPTASVADLLASGFEFGTFFNGLYTYSGLYQGNPYYSYSGGRVLFYRTNVFAGTDPNGPGDYWMIGDSAGGSHYMRCRCGTGYANCNGNDISGCVEDKWNRYYDTTDGSQQAKFVEQ